MSREVRPDPSRDGGRGGTVVRIDHHGAVTGVTGSCHELWVDEAHSVLVDCGLFQGVETSGGGASAERLEIDFELRAVQALLVTHCHLDHVGRIPYLLAAGFRGPIYCTEPTAILLPLMLEDALKVGFTRDPALVERCLEEVRARLVPVPYRQWGEIPLAAGATGGSPGGTRLSVKFQPAGHILGSAYVECLVQCGTRRTRVVFSGDLGATYSPLLFAPKPPYAADVVVLESTYGDRLHEDRRTRRQRLRQVIERCVQDRGVVLIPAFSIGRTQELLYDLEQIIHEATTRRRGPPSPRPSPPSLPLPSSASTLTLPPQGAFTPLPPQGLTGGGQGTFTPLPPGAGEGRDGGEGRRAGAADGAEVAPGVRWEDLDIIVDSPLASRFTAVYDQLKGFWDAEARRRLAAGRHPLSFEQLTTIERHQEHLDTIAYLQKVRRPAIVLAGSGMCAGGRIVNYLKAFIGDPTTDIVFVGYQAEGTPGRAIQRYGPQRGYVELDGERYPIRAGVHVLGGYSAHADQRMLVNFVRRMRRPPAEVLLVHGSPEAKATLQARLEEVCPQTRVIIPTGPSAPETGVHPHS